MCVKHLNPRQGITTAKLPAEGDQGVPFRVKHLNPRQGITTVRRGLLPRLDSQHV